MSLAGIAAPARSKAAVSKSKPVLEVDAGVALPAAFGGLRRVLQALRGVAPDVVEGLAKAHAAEWNRLFPGEMDGALDLSDLALSPSERRLHRESEQTFWILNLGAQVVLRALSESGRTLLIRNAGQCDLVSMRGLMRAIEWGRSDGQSESIQFADWSSRRVLDSDLFRGRRNELLGVLQSRMRAPHEPILDGRVQPRPLEAAVDPEGRYLREVVDLDVSPERRIAAAVLAIRECFFTTNYEGAMLAAERGLALLEQLGSAFEPSRVATAWDALDSSNFVTPAIEVDRTSLGDAEELRALFLRQIGVVQAFTGQISQALESFGRGLECKISPQRRGQLRMFRALTLIKRVGNLEQARAEVENGIEGMAGDRSDLTALHEGWLRNVYALTYFQEKKLEPALAQEKLALKCVGDLHDPSATHLKINLISNVSVLQEAGKRFPEAITTWRRFEKISANWGQNFVKHHTYRLAGLQMLAGERDEAIRGYSTSYESARSLGDAYHRQAIASELGRLHLDMKLTDQARVWYERAVEASNEIGDPLRLAESLAGLTLATGQNDFSEPARLAPLTSTYSREAKTLTDALSRNDVAGIQAVLPAPRTKLNRPFDLINL